MKLMGSPFRSLIGSDMLSLLRHLLQKVPSQVEHQTFAGNDQRKPEIEHLQQRREPLGEIVTRSADVCQVCLSVHQQLPRCTALNQDHHRVPCASPVHQRGEVHSVHDVLSPLMT